ncbi:Ectoine hydroxylase-related dioxygenase, phytanoyl-CoA dioxygenase (PhyH) family [Tistlia consotensis]|uniref:Ectoine hydroxylase-related dioxygenase, phytanoyl-CoA dioxygenase (PhyH) family n=1 Tax=Tistlia consotensis USBA 355 TaxID=560819 RepID=A0A1Y6B8C6_9PROT|nr:phytanoyl-CoA dioxygenase family protein [Tistlia consotensis]SME98148.1 Ectoine hydroxylase-related dioxygenase, phytanoyl-CoA dioxygenase (PhyH) family [Tistlia consotensis USBA 355]SNR57543.1 Ectoine hydroxylase-related dioxygenase, phytanoyl-CoA dioxygenase (PhyH) family [Tistlia consotensis]
MLSAQQIEFYREQGYLVLERVLSPAEVEAARTALAELTDRARGLSESNDDLDLEDSHRPDRPRVRRVKQPHRQSAVFDRLVRHEAILGPVRDLLGPSLRLQGSKLNLKAAGFGAAVEWHQDWAFYPHTNDDVLAIGVMLDDVDLENGPLLVVPGSHRGPVFDHHSDGVFCGAIAPDAPGLGLSQAVPLTAPAGSISLHHARTVHGSDLNRSGRDRRLLLFEVMAADAWPLMGAAPAFADLADFDARLLCGSPTLQPRLAEVPVRIPLPKPEQAGSIYQTQKKAGQRAFAVFQEAEEVA